MPSIMGIRNPSSRENVDSLVDSLNSESKRQLSTAATWARIMGKVSDKEKGQDLATAITDQPRPGPLSPS